MHPKFWMGYMDVSKNRAGYPKMDGENNGKAYEQIDDLGVALFLETPIYPGTNTVLNVLVCICIPTWMVDFYGFH